MIVEVRPGCARGAITAPPSKSMAHRLLICAGLSRGESVIRHLAYSQDVLATIDCLRALGAEIRTDGDTAVVKGADPVVCEGAILPCRECGSTLRFFIPLCLLGDRPHTLTGSAYLMQRPLTVYREIAEDQGLLFEQKPGALTVQGRLSGGHYAVRGDISSQFISGLLFALPLLQGDSRIELLPPVESRPYIDMTVAALRQFGIEIRSVEDGYLIPGGQHYEPAAVTVEGDYSNAAFFEALNYAGSDVRVDGLDESSLQGDRIYKILYKKINDHQTPIDIADCPDLGPILFSVAALCGGGVFTGTRRLRIKESDRAAAMRDELSKCGASVTVGENTVEVHPSSLHAPDAMLDGHGDHRIVMALAVLLTKVGGSIKGTEAVSKSFPDFFDRLGDLGIEVIKWNG